MFCDAHFHLIPSIKHLFLERTEQSASMEKPDKSEGTLLPGISKYFADFCGCSCAHSQEEYSKQKKVLGLLNGVLNGGRRYSSDSCRIFNSFGLHPQMPLIENADFLEEFLQNGELDAIGECGFDLFSPEFKQTIEQQKQAWHIQLELAKNYKMPLVIHLRKSMELIFRYTKELKQLPAVLFHSFPDNPPAAFSLLRHGINAYFSFGKQILNGNKKAIACVRELPLENLLLETDAPFQTLKNEVFTAPKEIERVYNAAYNLYIEENGNKCTFEDFSNRIQDNFFSLLKL